LAQGGAQKQSGVFVFYFLLSPAAFTSETALFCPSYSAWSQSLSGGMEEPTAQPVEAPDGEAGVEDGIAAAKKRRPKKKKSKAKEDSTEDTVDDAPLPPGVTQAPESLDTCRLYSTPQYDAPRPGGPPNLDEIAPEEWVDVSHICELASKGMGLGEMVESAHFRLFDAMSAIEIMDPKMDSGYNNTADMTLAHAIDTGVVAKQPSLEELIPIWDQLLMYYLMWLEGHTIVQTWFCCLYFHDLEACLRPIPLFGAFADAFLAACRRARCAVLRAGVFDDEDFLPSLFGIDLEASVFSSDPAKIRQRIEAERLKLEGPLAEAAGWRLELICEYMTALVELEESPDIKKGAQRAQPKLSNCLKLLKKINQNVSPPAEGALRCFDPSINRRLLVPGPPRTVEPLSDMKVVFAMWASHLQELSVCGTVLQKSMGQLLEGSTVCNKDEPNVLSRSVTQFCVSSNGLVRRAMLDSLVLFLFPREAVEHCKEPCEIFLDRCESLFAHLLKLAHANRARKFRRLAHVFADFNSLQHEAWQLDEDLKRTFGANLRHPRPCWVWIMEHCLQTMLTKLFLGFELDLYEQAEFHMIYWYADYLYGLRVYNLHELHHAKEQPVGGMPKRKPGAKPPPPQQRPKNPPVFATFLEATQAVVRGLFRLLAFCLREGLVASPPMVAQRMAQRFVLRFRTLEHFQLPHLPSYLDFQSSSASAQAPAESRSVLEAAQVSFAEASQWLEKVAAAMNGAPPAKDAKDPVAKADKELCRDVSQESLKSLKKVVVANQLAITQLFQRLGSEGKRATITVAPIHHPHFVTVQVKT